MSRLYYPPTEPALASGRERAEELSEKVIKLIPSEIVAGYITLIGFVPLIRWEFVRLWAYWIVFLLCLGLTPVYLNALAKIGKPKIIHLIVSTLAFLFWAYAISGQTIVPNYHDAAVASLLLGGFTLITAVIPLD